MKMFRLFLIFLCGILCTSVSGCAAHEQVGLCTYFGGCSDDDDDDDE